MTGTGANDSCLYCDANPPLNQDRLHTLNLTNANYKDNNKVGWKKQAVQCRCDTEIDEYGNNGVDGTYDYNLGGNSSATNPYKIIDRLIEKINATGGTTSPPVNNHDTANPWHELDTYLNGDNTDTADYGIDHILLNMSDNDTDNTILAESIQTDNTPNYTDIEHSYKSTKLTTSFNKLKELKNYIRILHCKIINLTYKRDVSVNSTIDGPLKKVYLILAHLAAVSISVTMILCILNKHNLGDPFNIMTISIAIICIIVQKWRPYIILYGLIFFLILYYLTKICFN
jgi:hypothetical protein